MNDLNLRVSGGIGEKVKKPAAPISMPYWTMKTSGTASEFFRDFLSCNSADNQLKLLKTFLNNHKNECMQETIQFLVLLFWHADAKHPVKGFLKKHITDSRTLCQPFIEAISSVITAEIKESVNQPYEDYIGTVTRLDACIDKFPPGAAAVSLLEIAVASYLVCCLESCIRTLDVRDENKLSNEATSEPLAPTEINRIYDLAHLTLRLLLYMIQKITDGNRGQLSSMFSSIKTIIAQLMLGKEVPMDTKSVSGIIYLTLYLFENGPDSWIKLLEEDRSEQSGTVNLSVYSAVATVVPPAELVAAEVDGQPAVLALTDRILAIGDRYSSESSHVLAVARSMLTVSRSLPGGGLAERLARFCWAHLEHHTDSVRHLAAQIMARVVHTCVCMDKAGESSALDELFTSLGTLDGSRKSLYVTLTALAEELGGAVLARRPDVIRDVIAALHTQAVQACVTSRGSSSGRGATGRDGSQSLTACLMKSHDWLETCRNFFDFNAATTFLETLLKKHIKESDTETIYQQWICVILDAVKRESEPAVLGILERILAKAVQWDTGILEYILPSERALSSYSGSELKCALLVLAVVRRAGVAGHPVAFHELMHTAYDADDEIRILSLSLVAETPRSTEPFSGAELALVLRFFEYNANAQAPNFRQLALARIKKILKRLEDSYKVLKRQESEHAAEIEYYLSFSSELRERCFASLVAGGNYGRRCTALQVLAWLHSLQLNSDRRWSEEQAEILYNLLEDSYENNKALALEVLRTCPTELIKPVQAPGYLDEVLAQASSVRPMGAVAASFKLLLLIFLPVQLEIYQDYRDIPEHKHFAVLTRLLSLLKEQSARAQHIARAARDAPMHGLLHCVTRLVGCLDARAISADGRWRTLVADTVAMCEVVNARVARVVNAASPEGLLPEELAAETADSSGGARLADGRAVTAQMVLLCGWRSVKETSLLLGTITSRLTIEGCSPSWTLSVTQVEHIGELFTELLARVKHRGAFEQAYVGFTMLLARLWKCPNPRLHQLPLHWFSSIERGFLLPAAEEDDPTAGEYCATRRGAGLPFMIQALVTTELATEPGVPRGRLLARCLALCLRVARAPPAPADAARAHLVLRALYRHTVPPAEPTAEAIMVAVRGFEADTWTERNSSTLLFSALTVRVFGVLRARGERLCVRNRMTGRIFFLRYPRLYDFLLEQLKSVSAESLRPSLFPTLLLLARLYPSALEGTVSNLKLERFLPHVVSLAGARDVSTRRLAARAAAPLVPPHRYVPHVQSLLAPLGDPRTKRNLCHGLLCQLGVLLDLNPDFAIDDQAKADLLVAIRGTFWIAAQAAGPAPCYLVADEWLKVLNLILLRFPKLLNNDLTTISSHLEAALFSPPPIISSGRETFLSNVVYMLLIVAATRERTVDLVMRCLNHTDYEVNLSILNYLLLLHGHKDDLCLFLEHISKLSKGDILEEIEKEENYVKLLCNVSENGYLECKQKALRVLALTNDTQKDIVKLKLKKDLDLSEEDLVMELIDSVKNGHASLSAIYLDSLLRLVSTTSVSLEVVKVLYASSSAGNEEETRETVVRFLEKNLGTLLKMTSGDPAETFSWRARVWGAVCMLLEDDAAAVRRRAARAVLRYVDPGTGASQPALASYAAQQWRRAAASLGGGAGAALLLVLATLDFCADVDTGDELGEECRVFDQNETHNVYLEEFTWTRECALELKRIHTRTRTRTRADTRAAHHYLQAVLADPAYTDTIQELCVQNVAECLTGNMKSSHPKIDLFLKILHK